MELFAMILEFYRISEIFENYRFLTRIFFCLSDPTLSLRSLFGGNKLSFFE